MRFTLRELFAILIVAAALSALLVPAVSRARRDSNSSRCASHLVALGRALHEYAVRLGNDDRLRYPPMRGGALWLSLVRTSPPLVEPGALVCPSDRRGWTTVSLPLVYRGPATDPARLAGADPLGADGEAWHSPFPSNVLLKRGDVRSVAADDPLWRAAERTTAP